MIPPLMYDCFHILLLFCLFIPYLQPKCLPYVIRERVLYYISLDCKCCMQLIFGCILREHSVFSTIAIANCVISWMMAQNMIWIEEKVGQFSDWETSDVAATEVNAIGTCLEGVIVSQTHDEVSILLIYPFDRQCVQLLARWNFNLVSWLFRRWPVGILKISGACAARAFHSGNGVLMGKIIEPSDNTGDDFGLIQKPWGGELPQSCSSND